jgi:PST family polysaccharide transporter
LIAALLTSAYVFLTALLNSLGKVETLAGLQVAGPAALALLAYPVARTGGVSGIAAMVAVSAAVSAVAALAAVMRQRVLLGAWFSGTSQWFSGPAAKHFLSISGVMLVTGFLASAAVLVVRGNIVHSQGLQRAGLFDAAWSISMNQVTLVLASVQTYYLPALSRASTPEEKTREISRVLIAATLVSAPVIAALELFQPRVLELFYSPVFHGAHQYLRWTLLGDYLKVASWILSVPMLAAADMKLFLASDLAATATFVGAAFLATFWREAAESAAMAFFFMYAVHLTISFLYVRFRQRSRLGYQSIALWMAGLALVATAASLSWSEARYR